MLKHLTLFFSALLFVTAQSFSQIGLKPLNSNPTIIKYLHDHPGYQWGANQQHGKFGIKDTVKLPFFDDFSSTLMYPDSSKWLDNEVYVNQDFPINPPTIGVATFDYLDNTGKPYATIDKELLDYGDTLTSQCVALGDSSGVAYTVGDSFYLSFFYQPRGRGDFTTENDSLKLLFLDNQGNWNHVWGVRGGTYHEFKQVLIPIKNAKYLFNGFQFQFVNLTHRWGNNNHWHLDYVYLNNNRNANDTYYEDYAIQSKPTSLFKDYAEMPYDHFLAGSNLAADSIYFYVSYLNSSALNTEVRHKETFGNTILVETSFSANAANTPAQGFAQRKVKSYDFSGLLDTAYPLQIERNYYVTVADNGIQNPPLFKGNDQLQVLQRFGRHFAYDDGTAESGFGFNDLKSDDGRIVVQFELYKPDTLRAIDLFITYNTKDISRQRFELEIYQDIAINGGSDELLYSKSFLVSEVYDGSSDRGFYTIHLDSVLELPAGKFYVGWFQDREYNLTVGFDKNNGYINSSDFNKHIYFNIGTGWIQNENNNLVGAPMIRPIVGVQSPFASTPVLEREVSVKIFPNPSSGVLNIEGRFESFSLRNYVGQIIQEGDVVDNRIDISNRENGIYFLTLTNFENQIVTTRVIKN